MAPMQAPRYQMPTHLNVPDKIDFPLLGVTISLTIRQGVYFLCGWSLAFQLWEHSSGLTAWGSLGNFIHWIGPFLLAFVTFVLAMHQVRGRTCEQWGLVWLRYVMLPHVFVWRSALDEEQEEEGSPREEEPGEELEG